MRSFKAQKVLVTGCAGFIGSHLAERLVKEGREVIGIDCFTDYYPRWMKERNIEWLKRQRNFTFYEANLTTMDFNLITQLLDGSIVIFHLAAQAGVRASWGMNFKIYVDNNINATQRLLEWAKDKKIKKFIYASSSSIYGDTPSLPMHENSIPLPFSPYGVSKLSGEHLSFLYFKNFSVPVIALRYFSVYGPRQRPDMAFHKFIRNILKNKEIEIYGNGNQTRDFTYIDDVVNGTLLAVSAPDGEIFNVGGGTNITVNNILAILKKLINKKPNMRYVESCKGDVRDTLADILKARKILGYHPITRIEDGLKKELVWIKSMY